MDIVEKERQKAEGGDSMVQSFEEWEELQLKPKGEGRMVEVLRGCFAGAKNEQIVAPLKIVYMDYSALRIGGDLICFCHRKVRVSSIIKMIMLSIPFLLVAMRNCKGKKEW